MTRGLGAALVGVLAGAFLTAAALGSALTPSVAWVKLDPPARDSYVSWVPCVRTSGWLLPVVQCMPTEARSEITTIHGTGVSESDCRLADPMVGLPGGPMKGRAENPAEYEILRDSDGRVVLIARNRSGDSIRATFSEKQARALIAEIMAVLGSR